MKKKEIDESEFSKGNCNPKDEAPESSRFRTVTSRLLTVVKGRDCRILWTYVPD